MAPTWVRPRATCSCCDATRRRLQPTHLGPDLTHPLALCAYTEWADNLLKGPFGVQAPLVIKEIAESVEANKDLSKAREARAKAYGPAYEHYLAFKRVVREAYGPTSKEYKRIHIASSKGAAEEGEDAPPPGGGSPG